MLACSAVANCTGKIIRNILVASERGEICYMIVYFNLRLCKSSEMTLEGKKPVLLKTQNYKNNPSARLVQNETHSRLLSVQ